MRSRKGVAVLLALTAAAFVLSCEALNTPPPIRLSGQGLPSMARYDEPPEPVSTVQPTYPEFAKEAQITGTVVLHVQVKTSGLVGRVIVVKGITGLNESAVDAVQRWVFKPAMKNQAPVDSWYEADLDFRLP